MTEIVFEEPPGKRNYGPKGKHGEIVAALKARPGEWAHVLTYDNAETARSIAYAIRHPSHLVAYRPEGAFESMSRTVKGERRVYARYVGGGDG